MKTKRQWIFGRSRALLQAVVIIITASLVMTPTLEACILCEAINKAKEMWDEANEKEAEANEAEANGEYLQAARLRRRALTLKGNACGKVKRAKSKHGAAAVAATVAAKFPGYPGDDECAVIIDDMRNTPGFGGGGGQAGGGPGGGGGAAGGDGTGAMGGAPARGGGINGTGVPGTTACVCIFLVGTETGTSEDFEVRLVDPGNPGFTINTTTFGNPATETGVGFLDLRVVKFEVDIDPGVAPGTKAVFGVEIKSTTDGEFGYVDAESLTLTAVGAAGLSGPETILVDPTTKATAGMKGSVVPLTWTLTNTSLVPQTVYGYLTTFESNSIDVQLNNLMPFVVRDFFFDPTLPGFSTGGVPFGPPLTLLPAAAPGNIPPESYEFEATIPAGGSAVWIFPYCAPPFCENVMITGCNLRLATAGSFVDSQQYIVNEEPLGTPTDVAKLLPIGEAAFPGNLDLSIAGTPLSIPIDQGLCPSQIADTIAREVQRLPEREDGSLKINGLAMGDMGVISGIPDLAVIVLGSTFTPGLTFGRCETVDTMKVSNLVVTPVLDGGVPTGAVSITCDIEVDAGIGVMTGPITAIPIVNGVPAGKPVGIPTNGHTGPGTFPIGFPDTIIHRIGDNEIGVRLDPNGAVAEGLGTPADNVEIEIVELSLQSAEPFDVTLQQWDLEMSVGGQPGGNAIIRASEDLGVLDSWQNVAQGVIDPVLGHSAVTIPPAEFLFPKNFFSANFGRPTTPDLCVSAGGPPDVITRYFHLDENIVNSLISEVGKDHIVHIINSMNLAVAPSTPLPPGTSMNIAGFEVIADPDFTDLKGEAVQAVVEVQIQLQAGPGAPLGEQVINFQAQMFDPGLNPIPGGVFSEGPFDQLRIKIQP